MTAHADAPASHKGDPMGASLSRHLLRGGSLREVFPLPDIDDESLYAVGHHLYAQARYDLALPVFGLLLVRDGLERRYLCGFAACLQMQGRPQAAIDHYLTAAVLDPNDPVPVFHACECLIATGRHDEAAEGLQKLQALCQPVVHDGLQKKAQALLDLMARSSKPIYPGRKNEFNPNH